MRTETIDLNFRGAKAVTASFLLLGESGALAELVETGPATCLESLLRGLTEHGVSPEDVRQVFLTHVHLDHAGAAGHLAELHLLRSRDRRLELGDARGRRDPRLRREDGRALERGTPRSRREARSALRRRGTRSRGRRPGGASHADVDYLDESIGELSAEVERVIAPFSEQVELLGTIPGVDRRTAEVLIAEIGVDMSRFPTSGHLASWAGMCPGNDESAGKRRSGKRTKGSKWLRTLTEAAHAAARTEGSYLSAHYYAGIKGLRGSKKAAVAVGHSILVICYRILEREVPYEDLGEEHFHKQRRCSSEAYTRRLVGKLERLGHKVALEPLVGST